MMKQPLSIAEVIGILLLLFALWIGGWTLAITAPTFAALQKSGIRTTARVIEKLPYRSVCSGRTCKLHVLRVRFFVNELVFAQLDVDEGVYNKLGTDDPIEIIFFESNPQEIWPAQTVMGFRPWTNYLVSGLLLLGGVGMIGWSRRLGKRQSISKTK